MAGQIREVFPNGAGGIQSARFIEQRTAIGITISQATHAARAGFKLPDVLNESVPSLIAYLGMMTVAILIITHVMDSLVWLLPVVIVLLAVAVRNAWRLLVGAPAD